MGRDAAERVGTVARGPVASHSQNLAPRWRDDGERDLHATAAALLRVGRQVGSFLGPIVVVDLLLGFSLMWAGHPVTVTLPGSVLSTAAMVGVAAFRPATLNVRGGGLLVLLAVTLLAYLVAESIVNGQPWTQRIEKFSLFVLLAAAIATGRLNIRSLVIGGCLGALVNVPLFYAGLAPNDYPPYLTGFYGDKNVSGLYYAIWGILGLLVWRGRAAVCWVAASGVLLFLTGSRTSMAAFIGALAWFALRNRVSVGYRLVMALVGWVALVWAVNNLAESSAFGDRTGTDWYRHQIEVAMAAKVAITPWYGLGLNEGMVSIGGRPQYFHDSYAQAFVEGGYLNLWVVVGAFVLLGVGLLDRRLHISRELLAGEAATIVILVCAWKLGEALMTAAAFFVLGICIALRLGSPRAASRSTDKRLGPIAWELDRPVAGPRSSGSRVTPPDNHVSASESRQDVGTPSELEIR